MRNFRKSITLCLAIIIITNTIVFGDINVNDNIKGALLGDLQTGEILYSYNIDEQLPMASITKLMTYLLMMEALSEGKISLDDDVVISGHAAATEGSRFGLIQGETVKLNILQKAMLIVSANDCATAVAEHISGTTDNFVIEMNEKASELGLLSASFINPHGLPLNDEETGQNHISISDMYKLTRHILNNYPELLEITKQKELVLPERNFSKEATNPMLKLDQNIDGLKTGYTDKAGLCLISTVPVEGNGQGFRLISIIMGAATHDDRQNKSLELLQYGINSFSSQRLIKTNDIMDSVYINNSKDGKVEVYAESEFIKVVNNKDVFKTKITYNDKVSAPLKTGEKIGKITLYINDEEIGQVDAVVNKDIKKANIFVRIYRLIAGLFN